MADVLKSTSTSGSNLATELLNTNEPCLSESGRIDPYACDLPMTHKDTVHRIHVPEKNHLGHLFVKVRAELNE